ncbi:uncharacterized protein B0I36DRAFT_150333 [Microdochium trichocladiopsis]|uniref:Uncharacterized protein n=1 Tax=Microdochium trichocladiopsis TaxID=1682393 RepID=A0A9P9BMI3_9PEZI|nr:uncharacterized protein B0I36DRAFT_150333 [Microdochium trichocladiopsis]KAH7025886.1 hypothetical protein B0I36DRAFT_150333 [Microdochium trichocladiopsis]
MQKSSLASNQSAPPFFTTPIWGGSGNDGGSKEEGRKHTKTGSTASASKTRPGTSSGGTDPLTAPDNKERERKHSFVRKPSFNSHDRGRRRSSNGGLGSVGETIKTDPSIPPAIPDFLANSRATKNDLDFPPPPPTPTTLIDSFTFSRSSSRATPSASTANMTSYYPFTAASPPVNGVPAQMQLPPIEGSSSMVHTHIFEMSNKRISTLEYLRKSHEGRLFWFNTLMFDKPDLARMPYYDSRRLARRAMNYLLLGLSLPIVIDLSSSTALEFLRSLNTLLTEFESYQQIHTENGINSSSFSRGKFPQMFRRGAGGKGRRTSAAGDLGYIVDAGPGSSTATNGAAVNAPTSVINFGLGGEGNDLLPGEEYTHLLTPNLPFEPDFFETFATLCDVLIDCYTRLMSLVPNPKDCTPAVAELFAKADSRVRKIIVQGVVKEFETTSRAMLKQEVENVGKVVLGGLM